MTSLILVSDTLLTLIVLIGFTFETIFSKSQ